MIRYRLTLSLVLSLLTTAAFSATVSAEEPIEIEIGSAEPLPELLFTFNTNLLTATAFQGIGYDSEPIAHAARTLRPQGFRFPGGTIANNYLWKEDSFSDPVNDKTKWASEQLRLFRKIGRPYDLPGFARLCQKTEAEPIWVLNVYEETPKSVVALFEKLDELGMHVSKVELGNEPYWDGRSLMNVWDYIKVAQPLALAIRKHRPNIQIGACFGSVAENQKYNENWNAPLARQKWFDAIVYHEYFGGQGITLEKGERVPAEAILHPEELFESPCRKFGKILPGMPIWFTEWNLGTKALKQWENTGAELLYLGASYCSLVQQRENIHLACFHQFYGGQFGTFYVNKQTGRIETNSSWQFFQLFGAMTDRCDQLRSINIADSGLVGFATQVKSDSRIMIVNRSEREKTLALPMSMTGKMETHTIHCSPETKLAQSTELIRSRPVLESSSEHGRSIQLPAYSINVIAAQGSLDFVRKEKTTKNLFPPRPHLTLWYAPYARQQPRFDTQGVYRVNLEKLDGKSLAVVKMDLGSLKLTPGDDCMLEFEIQSDAQAGVVVKLPSEDQGVFVTTFGEFSKQRFSFCYPPQDSQNRAEATFVFPAESISKGGTVAFRHFRISRTGN